MGGQEKNREKREEKRAETDQGYVRETYLYFSSRWYFPLLGNKWDLLEGHVNNSFYAFLHCMKKAVAVTASTSRPCDLAAFRSTGLTQIPLWCRSTISVDNSRPVIGREKVSIFILLCHLRKLIPGMLCVLCCLDPELTHLSFPLLHLHPPLFFFSLFATKQLLVT